MSQPIYTSDQLTVGTVYTRMQLQDLFSISDQTIRNGIFQPKGTNSVWLFITEEKANGNTPYFDRLDNDTLLFDGQKEGRTDNKLIFHVQNQLELLVFHRKNKFEYPGYGFRYEGPFVYGSHKGSKPAAFTLYRKPLNEPLNDIQDQLDKSSEFNPNDNQQGKQRILTSIVLRRGQRDFRNKLLSAYAGQCAVTGCAFAPILEAAHIIPYNGPYTNHTQNGLLLRADIHTLFDLQLLSVDPSNYKIWTAPELSTTTYIQYDRQSLKLPTVENDHPSKEALQQHFVKSIKDKS